MNLGAIVALIRVDCEEMVVVLVDVAVLMSSIESVVGS